MTMAMTTCAECKAEISDQAAACVKCGAPLPEPPAPPSNFWAFFGPISIVGACVVAVLYFAGVFKGGPPDERSRLSRAVTECWSVQAQKSNDLGTARFAARLCEQMEKDFVARFGHRP
jgi:hypothetical protein